MTEALKAFAELSGSYRIGAEYRPSKSKKSFEVIDPATEEPVGRMAECTAEEVEAVIALANKVQRHWARETPLERAVMLHETARRMRERKPLLAEMITREMGKTYKEGLDEVEWSATAIDYYAEVARHDEGRVMGTATPGQFHFTIKKPRGVAALILPFNYPYVLLCWEAGAALASGNAVIVKPSDLTSLCTLEFLKCFDNLPEGLVQCVTGGGAVGQQLVESDDTHVVCFTGGIATGQLVAKACGERFKACLIEASGNDPFLVMPSAPLDIAARGAAFAAFMNCGQICTSAERFYVHKDIHDEFVERLVAEAKKVRVGNGLDESEMGPMAAERERKRYEGVLKRAVEQGAKVAVGGGRPARFNKGWFVETTVLTGVTPDMEILNNESFGPVAPICRVESLDEAIALANRSRYGLGATVYTTELSESMRAVNEIESGMVWVNAPLLDNDAGPFGGMKMSGMGRQLGAEGLEPFRETKLAMIDPDCRSQDFWWFPYDKKEMYPGKR